MKNRGILLILLVISVAANYAQDFEGLDSIVA